MAIVKTTNETKYGIRITCEKGPEGWIVGKDGDIKIIDFNDWPSFAPCRYDAAPHIAKRIISIIKNR